MQVINDDTNHCLNQSDFLVPDIIKMQICIPFQNLVMMIVLTVYVVVGIGDEERAGDEVFEKDNEQFSVGRKVLNPWSKRQKRSKGDDSDVLVLLSDIIDEVLEEEKEAKKTKNRHGRQVAVNRGRRQQQFQGGCKTSG